MRECGNGKPKQPRISIRHPACSVHDYRCHNASLPNLLRALNERVFNVSDGKGGLKPTPQADEGVWERMGKISRTLARNVRERVPDAQRLTVSEFVEQCPAQKRLLYAQAGEEYTQRGISDRDARLKAFVKFEKIKFESSGEKSDPCPRLIQPRSPVFNVALGRYTRRIENELYHALADVWVVEEGEEVVMKGMTGEEMARQMRAKWTAFKDPVAIGLDASRFDQHVGVDALLFEHSIYEQVYKDSPDIAELRWLLSKQRQNRGFAFLDGYRVDYEIDGTRASGDMNTGLGNCLIMSCLARQYAVEKGIACKLANNGDDCLVFMERCDEPGYRAGLVEWFLKFGFKMVVEPTVDVFEECEFCQMKPVWSGSEWVMVRSPHNAIAKDTMALGFTAEEYARWIHAVGTAGLALYGDMPLFCVLYERMRQQGSPSNVRLSNIARNTGLFMHAGSLRGRKCRATVSNASRISFALAFGISPAVQLLVEDQFKTLEFRGVVDARLGTEVAIFN